MLLGHLQPGSAFAVCQPYGVDCVYVVQQQNAVNGTRVSPLCGGRRMLWKSPSDEVYKLSHAEHVRVVRALLEQQA